jgi:fatty-acyl-CoA synthase
MTKILLTESAFSGRTDGDLLTETIGNLFDRTAEKFANNPAIVMKRHNINWDYKTYQEHANNLALGLLSLGIKAGDRVGICAPNCIEWRLTA